ARRGAPPRGPAAAVATPEIEEATPEPEGQAADILDETTSWVPPAEMLEPGGRPWSPAAAMELLPGSWGASGAAVAVRPRSGWLMTVSASVGGASQAFAL